MKQLFRWPGLIAFVVIVAALSAFWLLLADTLIKRGVESVGSGLVGAEVNLGAADLSLDPLAVRLSRLQVTDPNAPAHNALEVGEALASIEPWPLLMGQLIINDLSVTGLQFNTPRRRPGRVKAKPKAEAGDEPAAQAAKPSLQQKTQAELPSVSEVMGREELLVRSRAAALQQGYAEERAKVDAALTALPDEKRRQQLQERYQRATARKPGNLAEFTRQKQELEQLQKELKAVRSNLEQGRQQLAASQQRLQQQLADLKAAPGEDLRRLRAKYSLSAEGGLNITRLLFGDKVGQWGETALHWYRKLAPLLAAGSETPPQEQRPERAKGRYIRFPSSDPLPDFLLRRAQLQAVLPFGTVDGKMADLTHQPAIIGRPATVHAAATQLSGARELRLDANFDHIRPEQAKDAVEFSLQGLNLKQLRLSEQQEFPLTLAEAVSDLSARITLQHGEVVAHFDSAFRNARFESSGAEGMAAEIAKALGGIDRFAVKGELRGTLEAPQLSLSSDLDKRLKEQLNRRLKERQAQFQRELKAALQQQIEGPHGEYQQHLDELQRLEAEVDKQLAENKKMLEAKVQGYQDDTGKQLGDKLKGLQF